MSHQGGSLHKSDLSSFGEWELQRGLGTGGFGEVLLWRNKRTNMEIATKSLKKNEQMSVDETAKLKKRWTQEYQWMQELDTKYIVRGVDVQDSDFVAYLNMNHAWAPLPVIIMEYCNGGDLRAQLQQVENYNGLLEYEVRSVLHALRHAVEYLHNVCRIEHRDIKPDNIVAHGTGRERCYKLTDFGFARNCTENTILKSVVGTKHYFAPEVVDTALYTNTVDYWSLGVIAYELMCGLLPFAPHQELFQIIVNIKKKPTHCIAIDEHLEEPNRFHFQTKLCPEQRLSSVFVTKMEEWLRLALDVNYQTRGSVVVSTAAPEQQRELRFYTMLDTILQTRVLTVFCANTYKFYSYEVTPQQGLLTLVANLEWDTGLSRKNFYFVYPAGHPRAHLHANTRPYDMFVDEWQDTSSESLNPPVMLYLIGYKCDHKASDPAISANIKRCLSLGMADALPPNWQLARFAQQVHFLLSNEQRHLEALLSALREYALTVENDIFNFEKTTQALLNEILLLCGGVQQFQAMIDLAEQAQQARTQPLSPNVAEFFQTWRQKSVQVKAEVQKIDDNVGQSLKKRYNSALRRAKEQANNPLYEELKHSDIYRL